MIAIKKEIRYLLQTSDTDPKEIIAQKESLMKQGYLVVTFIEGKEAVVKGLKELVRNHLH